MNHYFIGAVVVSGADAGAAALMSVDLVMFHPFTTYKTFTHPPSTLPLSLSR